MFRFRVKSLAACAALIALTLTSASAENARLTVEVLSADSGKPVERASVIVKFRHGLGVNMKKIQTQWETKTSEAGLVKLPSMPQGEVSIQVIAKGFQTHGGIYQLTEPEQTISIKVNRPQKQYSEHAEQDKDKK
jgi:5-hydroxyisourate hydrolase-like protein (transthyretin family)